MRYLRLYTSDDPNESDAQFLYEKFRLKETGRQRKLFYTKIYRELDLWPKPVLKTAAGG